MGVHPQDQIIVSVFVLLDTVANRKEHLDFEMPDSINRVQIH